MPDRLILTLVDVLGRSPGGEAQVVIASADPVTPASPPRTVTIPADRAAVVGPLPEGWSRVTLLISHPDYADEPVILTTSRRLGPPTSPAPPVYWDNRGAALARTGDDLALKVELGRVRQAPLTQLPAAGARPASEPAGVFFAERDGQPRRYLRLNQSPPGGRPRWIASTRIRALREVTAAPASGSGPGPGPGPGPGSTSGGPTTIGDTSKDGWERFRAVETPVTLADTGGFLFLEYGSVSGRRPAEPRFLIAVWAPPRRGGAGQHIDAVCFFSPSTAVSDYPRTAYPFRTNYPYAAAPGPVPRGSFAVQPYVNLGYRYLLTESCFVQAQHISGRPALLVMPIFPAVPDGGDGARHAWQPFNSQEGMQRLLLEVVHFLHRFGYGRRGSAGSAEDFIGWQGSSAPVGALPAVVLSSRLSSTPEPPPQLRDVTVSGFSSGIAGAYPLFGRTRISRPADYPPSLFGADGFAGVWREWWDLDLDLSAARTGIRVADYERALLAWFDERGGGRDRRIRLYHSQYTTGTTPADQLFAQLAKRRHTVTRGHAPGLAEEWRDPAGRWSAAFYSEALLLADRRPDGVLPEFPLRGEPDRGRSTHLFTEAIGFGHASTLRADS
ncbi:hypothetical protein ACWF94_01325 [Streptomyces sp. NPDC055078]